MILLAIECSSDERSVAVARDGEVIASDTRRSGRSTPLLGMIEGILQAAHLDRSEVEALAVGLGPGSYTGIRGSIAVAQGWSLATGARLVGIDSSAACAHRAHRLDVRGLVAIVIDAQRGEWYVATHKLDEDGVHALSPLRIATRAEVEELAHAGFQLAGPDLPTPLLAGRTASPDATSVAMLARDCRTWVRPEQLEPIYLRPTTFVKAPPPRNPQSPDPNP